MKAPAGHADTIAPVTTFEPPLIRRWWLPVGGGHEMQVQEFGRPAGRPALALHGGPGSGGSATLAAVFDPAAWRIVVPCQRGAGGSRPGGSLVDNTTDHLLADLRALRRALGIERWLVYGGSWGATLALAHAADEPAAMSALLLRSSFLGRDEDIRWFFDGARAVRPAAWQAMAEAVGHDDRLGTLTAWLTGADSTRRERAARIWRAWELALAGQPPQPLEGAALAGQVQRLTIQAHYLSKGCFLAGRPLLERCAALPAVPTMLLHARDDQICRFDAALALQARLPQAATVFTDEGGHDPTHPGLRHATAAALRNLAACGRFTA